MPPSIERVAGFVGRLEPQKGADLLIEAVIELRARGVPVHTLIAGDGPLRAALAARVEAAGGTLVRPKMSIGEYGHIVLAKDTEGNLIGGPQPLSARVR